MNDTKLRRQFAEWAAPLRATPPPPLESIRRRARIRAGRIAAAAASAAAVIALAVSLAVTGLGAGVARPSGPWGSGRYPAPPGQPYVYVSFSLGPTAQIRDAATGAVLATLRPPAPPSPRPGKPAQTTIFGVAAAAASDRLFVVAENRAGGTTTFAEVRILAAGRGAQSVRLGGTPSVRMAQVPRIVLPRGTQISDLVVNPAGTRFAMETQTLSGRITLTIYNLVTGQLIGSWPAGSLQLTSPLAFLPNGDLAVVWLENGPSASRSTRKVPVSTQGSVSRSSSPSASSPSASSPAAGGSSPGPTSPAPGGVLPPAPGAVLVNRIINPAVPFRAGSSMNADSSPDTALHRRVGMLTEDGNMSISPAEPGQTAAGTPGSPGPGTAIVSQFSSATGALVRSIPLGPASALNASTYCGVLWASADGSDLLTQCGTRQQEVVDGKVTAVRLAWIFPKSAVPSVSAFAW